MFDYIEGLLRAFMIRIACMLPVKVLRDDKGVPFLYRYHVLTLWRDGPAIYIHNFVKSDPGRGYHCHPWHRSFSFILCGEYEERILNPDHKSFKVHSRRRWTFNFLNGTDFHRVMVDEDNSPWTIFFHWTRSKTWSMVSLQGEEKPMSTEISDKDGGWWNYAKKGETVFNHVELDGTVMTTVDIIVVCNGDLLLIKRGKDPYKGKWAFPGGRVEPTDKDLYSAACRELLEETNIECSHQDLVRVETRSSKDRDPRGYSTTFVFLLKLKTIPPTVKAGDDAVDYEWFSVFDKPDMAFDHRGIVEDNVHLLL